MTVVKYGEHSHGPTTAQAHTSYRRQYLTQHLERITALLKNGLRPAQVLSTLRKEDPTYVLKAKDIYNLQRKLYKEFLAGRTPI